MKPKKRRPLNFLKYLCVSCGVVFLVGNLMLLKEDIFMLYRGIRSEMTPTRPISRTVENGLEKGIKIQLPLAAIAHKTKLRHLMENDHDDEKDLTVILHRYGEYISNVSRTSSEQAAKEGREKQHRYLVSINPDDLLHLLTPTSSCDSVRFSANERSFISAGWTKAVFSGSINQTPVAVKTVYIKGYDVTSCLSRYKGKELETEYDLNRAPTHCFNLARNKILREILLLRGLQHENIIKLKAYCVHTPSSSSSVLTSHRIYFATDLGEPIDLIKLLQMTWEDRLKIAYSLTKLLNYLSHSPYGPVILNDLRRQQFVLVNGDDILLSDLDDAGFYDPRCKSDADCTHHFTSANFTLRTNCSLGHCYRFNEMVNIYNIGRHFMTYILPYGCPDALCSLVTDILQDLNHAHINAQELLDKMNTLIKDYSSGLYLARSSSDNREIKPVYKEYMNSDLPGSHDYTCQQNIGPVCTRSVYDQIEAEHMCNADPQCAAFVISASHKTWTGRTLAYFKSNCSHPSYNAQTTLYVKPGFIS